MHILSMGENNQINGSSNDQLINDNGEIKMRK